MKRTAPNKTLKLIIYLVAIVLIFVVAILFYKSLSKGYSAADFINEQSIPTAQTQSKQAPSLIVYTEEKKEITLAEKKGKPVVINFWASWCPPCLEELPYFEEMFNKYKDKVEFMMVDLVDYQRETLEKGKALITQNNYTFPVFYDLKQTAARNYSLYSIPQTVFVDENGNEIKTHIGKIEKANLESYIQNLIDK